MPYQAYYLSPDGNLARDLEEKQIVSAVESGRGMLWLDVSETTQEDGEFLERVFHFHHLTIEDCLSPVIHSPKIDDFGSYLFIVIHGIDHTVESEIVQTAEMGLFLGSNFVVTNHNFHMYSIDAVRQSVEANGPYMKRGPDFFAHAVADALVDNVLPTVDKMSETAGNIEEEIITDPHQPVLESILRLKRSALKVHRIMSVQRDVFNRLSRGEFPVVTKEAQIFYRDVYDHVVRIEDLSMTVRDRADNALSTYLSSVANRQNETMKTLTMVATIFMPLTLLAGIYGMNFEYMPELKWHWAYFIVLGVMVIAVASMVWRFWVKGWLAYGRRHVHVPSFKVDPRRLTGYIEQATTHRRQNP